MTASCSRLSLSSTSLANEGEHLLVVPAEVLMWMLIGPAWSCAHLSLCLWSGMPAAHWSDWAHMIIPRVKGRVSPTETTWSENEKG